MLFQFRCYNEHSDQRTLTCYFSFTDVKDAFAKCIFRLSHMTYFLKQFLHSQIISVWMVTDEEIESSLKVFANSIKFNDLITQPEVNDTDSFGLTRFTIAKQRWNLFENYFI